MAKAKKAKAKKAKALKKPRITKAHYEEYYQQIREKEREVRELEMKADLAKAESSRRKKEFEEADLELRNLISRGPDLQGKLPFVTPAEVATPPEEWRKPHIDTLGLPPTLTEKLVESDVQTIGDLEDLRAQISTGKAKWPKGIGEAKITLIEDAVINWLAKNQQTEPAPVVAEEATRADEPTELKVVAEGPASQGAA